VTYPATYEATYTAPGAPVTSPLPVLPQIIAEAGLVSDNPSQPSTALKLNDATLGKLDTGTLGTGITWSEISPQVLGFTITRPSTRLAGPLWNYQPGTISVLLDNSDGRFDVDNLAGPYVLGGVTQLAAMVPVRVRCNFGSGAYALYSGFADGWLPAQVTYEGGYAELTVSGTDAFKVLAGITLPAVSLTGVGADTGTRVRDILSRAGWYTSAERNVIDTGNSLLQGTTLGDTALNLMQLAVDSEIGQLYVNGAGAVVFRARRSLLTDTRSNTVQAVFGDLPGTVQPAGTELPYAAVGRASDDTTIVNDVQATRAGSSSLQEVKDAASIAKYLFPRTYPRSDLILQGDPDALSWAQWVLSVGRSGEDRFESLAVDPQADPVNLWPQVLGREIGDRIQVWHRPAQGSGLPYSAGSVTSPAAFANILFLNVTPGTYTVSWTVTLAGTLSAADVNNFGLYNGTTFVAGSINPASPGTYPQAPVTFTVTGGAPDIKILSAGNTPTTGAVYGAAIPSPVVKDCFIAGITHVWDSVNSAWLTTFSLQDASKYGSFLTLDNVTLGKLDSNALSF
jgi:hypothetical protein